jgi:sigma-B regulation protein RsbU (phosphoserine phosphatase)
VKRVSSEIASDTVNTINANRNAWKSLVELRLADAPLADALNDVDRLAAVRRYDILDTPPDSSFDRITTIAARIFQVPIALITIVDEDRIWLKSRFGALDISQIPREPGLCASAICQAKPYVVEGAKTDPRTRNNSLVSGELGIQFYAAAPLRTLDGYNLGTLCILDDKPRQLARSEIVILESLAAIVVDELELRLNARRMVESERVLRQKATKLADTAAHLYQRQRDAAIVLQNALLPRSLPKIDRLRVNGVYVSAAIDEFVGGDWYDVLAINENRVFVSIGDVAGHGLDSAVVMGNVKQSIRTAAREHQDPKKLLHRLNAMLCDEDFERIVTAFLGFLEPQTGRFTYANAGHPPPIVRHRDGTVTMLETGDDPLGFENLNSWVDKSIALDPGSMLVLYTDGLTEARRNVLEGEQMVCDAVRSDAIANAENPAEALRRAVIPLGSHDDVAILTVMLL